jgi:hypothetical protein
MIEKNPQKIKSVFEMRENFPFSRKIFIKIKIK